MKDFQGIIIEESLKNKAILNKVKIISTNVSAVTERHRTPWLEQWTVHTVEVPEDKAHSLAEEISKSIDEEHNHSWYADYKNNTHHYIIFRDKIFYIDRRSQEQYNEARNYGITLGIPQRIPTPVITD